jgi:ABC-2 type transport system ATP-binding protein
MLEEMGEHAVDLPGAERTETHFFASRDEALAFAAAAADGAAVRRANLEDLFLQKTGRRVQP